jgi:cytochrome P450
MTVSAPDVAGPVAGRAEQIRYFWQALAEDRYDNTAVREAEARWASMRREAPVVRRDPREVFDLPPVDHVPEGGRDVYWAVGLDAVREVFRHPAFTSSAYRVINGVTMGHTILEMDGVEHATHRALVARAFGRRAIEHQVRVATKRIVDEHLDRLLACETWDLKTRFALTFPAEVIADVLGLPSAEVPHFCELASDLVQGGIDISRAQRASAELGNYFAETLRQRRTSPADDVISLLAQAEIDGVRLDDDEIKNFLRLLLPAGVETTYRAFSNLVVTLLRRRELWDELRTDRALVPAAVDELIRWEPPLTVVMRMSTQDTDLCGVPVPADSVVAVCFGAGNRDERAWQRPAEFDLHRTPNPHAGFGYGPHLCLGIHLARMEMIVALNALLDRAPDLALVPGADTDIVGFSYRAPLSVPVFSPRPLGTRS